MCSVKAVFLQILQNSQEIACARVFIKESLLIKKKDPGFSETQECFPVNFVKRLYEHLFS